MNYGAIAALVFAGKFVIIGNSEVHALECKAACESVKDSIHHIIKNPRADSPASSRFGSQV
jgi:hypothetical protein